MKHVASVALLLASCLLCLALFEVGFRLLSAYSPQPTTWNDRPKFSYIHEASPTLQDAPHSPEKPAGTYRIAVVGDSFTFAPFMQFDDAFPKRLERMLNLNVNQPKVEVINYGVPRYSTSHEIDVVKRALAEGADLILLQVTLNDPEIKPYRPTGLLKEQVNRWGELELNHGIFRYWHSLAFVVTRIYNMQSVDRYKKYFFGLFEKKKSWDNFQNSVKTIQSLTTEKNVPLAAVVFPLFGLPVDDSYPFHPLHEKVRGLFNQLGIKSLDLFTAYENIPPARLQVIPGKDFHPNEIGHRIAAEAIYSWMAEQQIIPDPLKIRSSVGERIGLPKDGSPSK